MNDASKNQAVLQCIYATYLHGYLQEWTFTFKILCGTK